MKIKNRKIKLSNVLILLGIIVISLNVFFIVVIEPMIVEKRLDKTWNLNVSEILDNNQRNFIGSDLNLEVLDNSEVKNNLDYEKIVGYLSIPNVNLSLPILRGSTQENLDISATTVLENQIMGKGNYPIAGHRTIHPDTLFSPLSRVKENDEIYLTNKENIYIYSVNSISIVSPESIEVLGYTNDKAIITLITCYGKKSELRKIIVGEIINSIEFSEKDFKEYFMK